MGSGPIIRTEINDERVSFFSCSDRHGAQAVNIIRTNPWGLSTSQQLLLTWAPAPEPAEPPTIPPTNDDTGYTLPAADGVTASPSNDETAPDSIAEPVSPQEMVFFDAFGQPIHGLFNDDMKVGFEDYFLSANHYGSTPEQSGYCARFDLDGKGKKNHGAKPVSRNRLNDYIAKDQPGIPPRVKRRTGDLRRGKASPSPSIAIDRSAFPFPIQVAVPRRQSDLPQAHRTALALPKGNPPAQSALPLLAIPFNPYLIAIAKPPINRR